MKNEKKKDREIAQRRRNAEIENQRDENKT